MACLDIGSDVAGLIEVVDDFVSTKLIRSGINDIINGTGLGIDKVENFVFHRKHIITPLLDCNRRERKRQ